MGWNAVNGYQKNDAMGPQEDTLDFLSRDGTEVMAEYRVNKRERPYIRMNTKTITKTKKKAGK